MVKIVEVDEQNVQVETEIEYNGRRQRSSPDEETPYWTKFEFEGEEPGSPVYIREKSTIQKVDRDQWLMFTTLSGCVAVMAILAFAPIENLNKPRFLARILKKVVMPYQNFWKFSLAGLLLTIIFV